MVVGHAAQGGGIPDLQLTVGIIACQIGDAGFYFLHNGILQGTELFLIQQADDLQQQSPVDGSVTRTLQKLIFIGGLKQIAVDAGSVSGTQE